MATGEVVSSAGRGERNAGARSPPAAGSPGWRPTLVSSGLALFVSAMLQDLAVAVEQARSSAFGIGHPHSTMRATGSSVSRASDGRHQSADPSPVYAERGDARLIGAAVAAVDPFPPQAPRGGALAASAGRACLRTPSDDAVPSRSSSPSSVSPRSTLRVLGAGRHGRQSRTCTTSGRQRPNLPGSRERRHQSCGQVRRRSPRYRRG